MERPNNGLPILEVKNIAKNFSGVYALKNVSIKLYPGQILAVIGENGAGKSTLMKIITGVYQDYEGQVLVNGEIVNFSGPKEAVEKGVAIIHQELNLIPNLTIVENIFLGQELTNKFGMLDCQEMRKRTTELLSRLNLSIPPATKIEQLRVGQQQLVEIAKALLFDSKVLIMDEPTSAISNHEIKLLFKIINNLRAKGVSIIYISHKLTEVFEIANHYTVLRDGELIGSGKMAEITYDQIIQMMVGRNLKGTYNKKKSKQTEEILRVENLCFRNPVNINYYFVNNVSFTLNRGEVLGIFGLMGAGRTELLEAIFGLFPKYVTGKIFIEGIEQCFQYVNDAIDAGFALVPEDRKLQGLILNMNVTKNTSLASLGKISKFSYINRKKEEALTRYFIDKLRIKVSSSQTEVHKLSGGNQQKIVIAKWLATIPKVLLMDEPTRGIDIGSKVEIYNLINELTRQGMGIVIVSSELTEILAISDTIMVLSESKQTAKMNCSEATEEIIMKAALIERE